MSSTLDAPVGQAMVRLAWPLAVSGTLIEGCRLVALYWMGRHAGPTGLGVMAIMGPIELMVGWVFVALSAGAGSLVAQSIGARRGNGMSIVSSATTLVLVVSVVLGGAGILASQPLAEWL